MDKNSIKKFAINARKDLIKQVKQKAYEIGIEEDKIFKPDVEGEDSIKIHNRFLNKKEVRQRKRLISEIEAKGYQQVMEEVAYTWFNRFVALRFMEVNDYLPTGVRVLSSGKEGKTEPDIISEALNIDLDIDKEKVFQFQDNNDTERFYKYLLIKQCNSLHDIMPFIFEEISDYTEILLPDNLLSEGSVIRNIVEDIEESSWREVEIIGWMYQFYISEKKDEVYGSDGKIEKDEIPAATQLFTPDWIVKYMVENSLGRYWLETYDNQELQDKWEYYLEEPEQEPEVQKKLDEIRDRNLKPEEITVLDPACGSGHILVYAFEVLFDIYKSSGYLESDITQLILNNNLYGLEICDRAGQLASFTVMMKAREKDSLIFDKQVNLNICSIQETNRISEEAVNLLVDNVEDLENKQQIQEQLDYLIETFKDAKIYGSLIEVNERNLDLIKNIFATLKEELVVSLFDLPDREIIIELLPDIIKQAEIMKKTYDIVVTNPPYMGKRSMNNALKSFLKDNYNEGKNDIYAAFFIKCLYYTNNKKYLSMITQQTWMFLKNFSGLRKKIVNDYSIVKLIHLGPGAFEEIGGEVVQSTSFIIRNIEEKNHIGEYIKLDNYSKSKLKKREFFNKTNSYKTKSNKFEMIPKSPIAYWTNARIKEIFNESTLLKDIASPKQGLATGKNKKFLRHWYEVNFKKIGFGFTNRKDTKQSLYKWFPYNKGGNFRKWYGNNKFIVNWENDGKEIRNFTDENGYLRSRPQNMEYYFREGITWTFVGSSKFGVRYTPKGFIFDVGGSSVFPSKNDLYYILGFMGSKLAKRFLMILNPTMNFQVGNIGDLPIIKIQNQKQIIENIAKNNIEISKKDWNSFEISWDFKKPPLLVHKNKANTIEKAFNNWSKFAENQFYQLKQNEEKLNEIFIDIYGLEDELDPEVPEEDVTVRKADKGRDISSFVSYAVGCMLGRYSLDEEGLIYAGGEFDTSRYETYAGEEDNIIPILKGEYFENDIVNRFIDFVEVIFGKENLEKNLEFIADALIESGTTGKDTPRDTIRYYFLYDFIKDHVSTYNKRPIYWLFQSSGRRKAFNALIYMHRYDENTVARVRTEYLHELQSKLRAEKSRLQSVIDSELSSSEKNKARRKLKNIDKDMDELIEYDEKLNHLANKRIEIDLDDGVKENYKKFDEVLAKI